MEPAPDTRRSPWSRAYQSARLLVDVIGVVTALSGTVLTAYYKISDYRSSCEAKGLEPFVCFGGSLGWVDIEALQQKNQKIATLQSELDRVRADVARLTVVASAEAEKPADKRVLESLREATEGLRQRDVKIAELTEKYDRLNARYTTLVRTSGTSSGTGSGAGSAGTAVAARPNPNAFSTTVWPSGTLPHGETRRATTEHGTLQCTGSNTNTGAPRSCVWLP